jgi:hypothetical protein
MAFMHPCTKWVIPDTYLRIEWVLKQYDVVLFQTDAEFSL